MPWNFLDHFLTNVVELVFNSGIIFELTYIHMLLAGKVIDPIGCPLNHYDHTFMCHGQLELKLRPKYSLLTLPSLGCV